MNMFRNGDKVYTVADIERLEQQLANANEDYKTLFSAFESCQDELKKSNERESVLSCQLDSHMERVAELEKENKRESMELRSRLGSALGRNSEYNSAIENMQQKLAKANERVNDMVESQNAAVYRAYKAEQSLAKANERIKELEEEFKGSEDDLYAAEQQLSSYENALEEVQAVFVDSDACPLFEPFNPKNLSAWLNKFAIEKKIEGAYAVISLLDETKDSKTTLMANNYVREQLRKEQE